MDHIDLLGVLDLSDGLPDGLDLPDVLDPPDVRLVQEGEDAFLAREKLPFLHDKVVCFIKKRK